MAGKLNKFQMLGFQHWKGLTKENHLGSIFQLAPQKASNLMVQLLAFHRGKTLDTFLSQFPTKEFADDNEYTWDVVGSSRRNIPLIEARDENGTPINSDEGEPVGAGTTPFYLVFAEDWFADGEVIAGNLNEVYPFRILGDPHMEGTNAVYKVELMGGNTAGCPRERLLAGERFSVEYAPVEKELSRKVGDVRFSTPVSMRNEWSTIRIQHKVPGSMLNKKLAIGIPVTEATENGGLKRDIKTMWMHVVDYEVECQFSEYKNNIMMFGRSNRNANGEYMNFGKSGNVIKMGAGLREQMEVSNTMYYNTFSLKLLEDALYELSASKLDFGDRTFVIKTGERGAIQFHKAVLNEVSCWTQFATDGNPAIIQKTQSKLHSNALTAGFQFVEYMAPNGVRVKIDVDPYYDDPVRNKVLHPSGGVAESYRYDILYIGTADQPNIFKCKIAGDDEYRGYQWGLRNPFTGQKNNPYMSFDEDSAVMHRMATLGVCVLDPTRTMSLIPAILQA